ncbi:phiSA1p31-related protein [Streptomyces sp. NBC_01622]|uniref:phiSA1p31-related protein n=1 Tax=Streptomyces sp. NBC_01622 TaxID=2975903 RepID=UPI0038643445|nr:phiSA1p31-related protein [Streptomyces sp. NBC_01622]
MTDRNIIGFDVDRNGDAAIVVAVQRDGSYTVRTPGVCKSLAAELLRGIADRLDAEHGPFPCTPAPEQHDRPREDEPARPRGGRLDRDRGVYRDPRGDSWDLSLLWGDEFDREWKWHGSTDRLGEPLLRAEDDGEVQPLGVLRALYGPISPRSGGAA